ncbi:MAG: hypothetical protein ABIK09_14565 [Pseudomonadota bacterium]
MLESRYNRIALLAGSFLVLAAIFGTQALRLELRMDRKMAKDFRLAETSYMPPNQVLRFASLGYEPFVADMVFINAQQYFFNHLIADRKFDWLSIYTDAIVGYCRAADGDRRSVPPSECSGEDRGWVKGLFPFNPKLYTWATEIVKFVPRLTMDTVDRAIAYGRTGVEFCPDSWEIYFELGFNEFFEHHGISMEEREERVARGLEHISIASKLPGARVNPNFVAGHLWKRAEAGQALEMVYRTYYHANIRERGEVRERLTAWNMDALARHFAGEEERRRSRYPFLTPSFFHQIDDDADLARNTQEIDQDG